MLGRSVRIKIMKTFIPHLYGLSIFCFVMCVILLSGASSIAVPESLAFSTMGTLSGFTASGLRHVNKRLDELNSTTGEDKLVKQK